MDEVLRYCRSKLPSQADAEDATQETLLRAWALRHRGEQSIGWFIKTASYVCSELRRRNSRNENEGAVTPKPGYDATDPERLAVSDAWLCQLFDKLSPDDRALLSHLYLQDGSPEELAARLGLSPGGTRMAAMRARQRARDAIALIGGAGSVVSAYVLRNLQRLRDRLYRLRALNPAQSAGSTMTLLGETPAALFIGTVAVVGLVLAPIAAPPGHSDAASASISYANASTPGPQKGAATGPVDQLQSTPPPATPTPSPAPTGGATSLVQNIVSPGQNATPEQANITSFTASPNYSQDHTVFASGVLGTGCSSTCDVVFETSDSGKTWRHLQGKGYTGDQVILSPTYPGDSTIYAAGPTGLQKSTDAGATFLSLLPQVTVAAPNPQSSPTHTELLLGEVPLVGYDVQTGTLSSGPLLPAGVDAIDALAYAGDANDLLVAAKEVDPLVSGQQSEVILQCTAAACTNRLTLPHPHAVTFVTFSPFGTARAALVLAGGQAWISEDGGGTFSALPLLAGNTVASAAVDPTFEQSHILAVALLPSASAPSAAPLVVSHDGGVTLASVATSGLPSGSYLGALLPLPGGLLLGAPTGASTPSQFGMRCSTDWGVHWTSTC